MITRLTFLMGILLAPLLATAQPLADRVPADSMIYVGWQGSADLGPGYAQSNLKAVLDDSNIPEFLDKFLPEVLDKVGQINPQAGGIGKIVAAIGKPTWQHPTAFFIAGIDHPAGQSPVPHLGIIWQAGADGDALAKQLEDLIGQAPVPFPVKVFHDQQLVALMVGYDDPKAALGGGNTKALTGDAAFKATMAHLTVKDASFAAYVDYERVFGTVDDLVKLSGQEDAGKVWPKLRDRLGLPGMKHLAIASGFEGKNYGTQAFLESPEPRTGLLKLASGKPLGEEIIAAIPSTVTMAGAGRFDLASLFDLIRDTADDVDPKSVRQFDRLLDEIAKDSDVNLRKDLLASLGDEWAYFADPTIGGRGLASFTVVNHLKDAAKFEESMAKIQEYVLKQIEKESGQQVPVKIGFETAKIDGMTVHYLAVPLVQPSWIVQDGNLYVAPFAQVAVGAARHFANKGDSILKNPGFIAVGGHLRQENPASFSFMDLPKTAPDAYGTWLLISRLAGFGDLFGVKSPPMILPELPKLVSHLSPAGSVKWVDAEGFHLRAIEPFPGSTVLASDPMTSAIYAEPVLISILLPALNRAREQANRIKSASNLKQIGLAAAMYANGHKGQPLPPDLRTMIAEEDLTPQVFTNPRGGDGTPPPADRAQWPQWVEEHSDYVWVGRGKTAAVAPDTVIAYEKPDGLSDGINFLYGDFHVEFVRMAEAQELIEKSKPAPKVNGNL